MEETKFEHSESETRGVFTASAGGKELGKMTYSKMGNKKIIIDHTEVYQDSKGSGVGKSLVEFGVKWARENEVKILPLCPFAKTVIERDKSLQDVLG